MPRYKDETRAKLIVAVIFVLFAIVVAAVYFVGNR